MKKKRQSGCVNNQKGFTLVEVMVAFVILLLASQLLISGAAVARKMEKRANEISAAGDLISEKLADESSCIAGTLRLEMENSPNLVSDGWLYRYETEMNGAFRIEAVRVDDPASVGSGGEDVEESE